MRYYPFSLIYPLYISKYKDILPVFLDALCLRCIFITFTIFTFLVAKIVKKCKYTVKNVKIKSNKRKQND